MNALDLPARIHQHRFDDPDLLADTLARRMAQVLTAAIGLQGWASIAIPGGRTPGPFLQALARAPLDWSRVWVTLTDERWVAVDSADSNERLARSHLLQGPAAEARFLGLKHPAETPEAGAVQAGLALKSLPRPLSSAVIGVGEDGHFASLFPCAAETAAALAPTCLADVVAVHPRSAAHARLSLSLRMLLDSEAIVLLTAGAAKRKVLERAASSADPARLPIAAVLHQSLVPVHLYHCET